MRGTMLSHYLDSNILSSILDQVSSVPLHRIFSDHTHRNMIYSRDEASPSRLPLFPANPLKGPSKNVPRLFHNQDGAFDTGRICRDYDPEIIRPPMDLVSTQLSSAGTRLSNSNRQTALGSGVPSCGLPPGASHLESSKSDVKHFSNSLECVSSYALPESPTFEYPFPRISPGTQRTEDEISHACSWLRSTSTSSRALNQSCDHLALRLQDATELGLESPEHLGQLYSKIYTRPVWTRRRPEKQYSTGSLYISDSELRSLECPPTLWVPKTRLR